jgi:hypothetical protein
MRDKHVGAMMMVLSGLERTGKPFAGGWFQALTNRCLLSDM